MTGEHHDPPGASRLLLSEAKICPWLVLEEGGWKLARLLLVRGENSVDTVQDGSSE